MDYFRKILLRFNHPKVIIRKDFGELLDMLRKNSSHNSPSKSLHHEVFPEIGSRGSHGSNVRQGALSNFETFVVCPGYLFFLFPTTYRAVEMDVGDQAVRMDEDKLGNVGGRVRC